MIAASHGYHAVSGDFALPRGAVLAAVMCPFRRSFAVFTNLQGIDFAFRALVKSTDNTTGHIFRGTLPCKSRNGSRAQYARLPWLLAATQHLSKALSARVQVLVQPFCWTVTPLQALLLAASPMWPSASATRTAADPVAGVGLQHELTDLESHRTLRSGGFLLSDAGQMTRCQDQEGA